MITEKDLRDAISECLAAPNPNANTCMMLAAFYTILDHYKEGDAEYSGDSEFATVAGRVSPEKLLEEFDHLMQILQAVNPRLYDSTLKKLKAWE